MNVVDLWCSKLLMNSTRSDAASLWMSQEVFTSAGVELTQSDSDWLLAQGFYGVRINMPAGYCTIILLGKTGPELDDESTFSANVINLFGEQICKENVQIADVLSPAQNDKRSLKSLSILPFRRLLRCLSHRLLKNRSEKFSTENQKIWLSIIG